MVAENSMYFIPEKCHHKKSNKKVTILIEFFFYLTSEEHPNFGPDHLSMINIIEKKFKSSKKFLGPIVTKMKNENY